MLPPEMISVAVESARLLPDFFVCQHVFRWEDIFPHHP
jgi:hypothetical protein